MNFSWSDEQLRFYDAVVEFARRTLNENMIARDEERKLPLEQWNRCAEFGIQGLPFPEKYSGGGADLLTTMLGMQALGYGCKDAGLLFAIHAQMWSVQMPLLEFGTEEQKERYLPKLCDGSMIGAHGMSEPDSGSDAFSMNTRAARSGDHYLLNGTKTFVTNAPDADLFLVFATVDPSKGMWGTTAFLVDRGNAGLTVGQRIEKLGLHTAPMAELVFQDCAVPVEYVLGNEGHGAAVFNQSMDWERSFILSSTVGAMERQLETCTDYVKKRQQFGRPIGDFQLVASRIVDMKVRLETSKLLLHRLAWMRDCGDDVALDAAIAKLHISEAAVESALDAIQVHGGYGYTREFEIERDLRDSLGCKLYSGTSEIQRLLIASHLGLSPVK